MSYFRAATFYGKYWTKTSDALQTNVKRDLSDEFYSRHSLRCMTLPEALCFYSQFQRSFIMLDKRDKSTHYAINIFTKPNISVEDPTLSWSPGIMYALHQATGPHGWRNLSTSLRFQLWYISEAISNWTGQTRSNLDAHDRYRSIVELYMILYTISMTGK